MSLPAGECIEVNLVSVNQSCPVAFNTTRSVRFDLAAHTSRSTLTWRRAASSSDALTPAGGTLAPDGTTSVVLSDIVLDSSVTFEIVDDDDVLLSLTLRHY